MINDIQQIFRDNKNKWMTDREVFNILNDRGYNWGANKRGSEGHKNMVARELSERHRDKFDIDKSFRPQKYRLKDFNYEEINSEIAIDLSLNNEVRDIDRNEINEFKLDVDNLTFQEYDTPIKSEIRKYGAKREGKTKKINYDKRSKRNKSKGDIGEEAIILLEKNKLIGLGRKDLSEKVEWVAKSKGDGLGYDIISWNIENEEWKKIYIEVKTTEGDINTPFDISDTEVRVSERLAENYYIYRIFGIEKITCKINFYIIKGSIKNNFDLIPTSYKAYFKISKTT